MFWRRWCWTSRQLIKIIINSVLGTNTTDWESSTLRITNNKNTNNNVSCHSYFLLQYLLCTILAQERYFRHLDFNHFSWIYLLLSYNNECLFYCCLEYGAVSLWFTDIYLNVSCNAYCRNELFGYLHK